MTQAALKAPQEALDYAFEVHPFTQTPRSVRKLWAEAKLNKTKLHILNHILERETFEPDGAHIYIDTLAKIACVSYGVAQKNLKELQKAAWVQLFGNPMMGYYMRLSLPESAIKIVSKTAPRRGLAGNDLQRNGVVDIHQYYNTTGSAHGSCSFVSFNTEFLSEGVTVETENVSVITKTEDPRQVFEQPKPKDAVYCKYFNSLLHVEQEVRQAFDLAKKDSRYQRWQLEQALWHSEYGETGNYEHMTPIWRFYGALRMIREKRWLISAKAEGWIKKEGENYSKGAMSMMDDLGLNLDRIKVNGSKNDPHFEQDRREGEQKKKVEKQSGVVNQKYNPWATVPEAEDDNYD